MAKLGLQFDLNRSRSKVAPFNWQCPFCGHHSTLSDSNYTRNQHSFIDGNKYGRRAVVWLSITCPNPKCHEYTFQLWINAAKSKPNGDYDIGESQHQWQLIPAADMKIFPEYVPAPIVADYKEACLIAALSPKASATLSRRCLQGMIRDFWGISKSRLVDEIDAIKDKVDELAWDAIDSLRKMGNIGAHMEKDINVIVDVDPDEAKLLIGLIETLVDDWYVTRHQRKSRMEKLVDAVKSKFSKPEAAS
jgi:hypothetical protein